MKIAPLGSKQKGIFLGGHTERKGLGQVDHHDYF